MLLFILELKSTTALAGQGGLASPRAGGSRLLRPRPGLGSAGKQYRQVDGGGPGLQPSQAALPGPQHLHLQNGSRWCRGWPVTHRGFRECINLVITVPDTARRPPGKLPAHHAPVLETLALNRWNGFRGQTRAAVCFPLNQSPACGAATGNTGDPGSFSGLYWPQEVGHLPYGPR